jgi:hypothetical protein
MEVKIEDFNTTTWKVINIKNTVFTQVPAQLPLYI